MVYKGIKPILNPISGIYIQLSHFLVFLFFTSTEKRIFFDLEERVTAVIITIPVTSKGVLCSVGNGNRLYWV